MTVREIATSAAEILQADDLLSALESGEDSALEDTDVKTLLKCVWLAVSEAAVDFPLLSTVDANSIGGRIAFVGSEPFIYIKSVERNGRAVPFTADGACVSVRCDGVYQVTYAVRPQDCAVDEAVTLGADADRDMIAYLCARNYCLATGRYDEAGVWDQRYCGEAERRRIRRRATMPAREWR